MDREYVEQHFARNGEASMLARLRNGELRVDQEGFATVQQGARTSSSQRRGQDASPSAPEPSCVLGSLAKALRHMNDHEGAAKVEADIPASLLAGAAPSAASGAAAASTPKSRLIFAVSRAHQYGYQPLKTHIQLPTPQAPSVEFAPEHPTLLWVSHAHVLTVLGGLIFDSIEPEPLELNAANLERCIGTPCDGARVLAYTFRPFAA